MVSLCEQNRNIDVKKLKAISETNLEALDVFNVDIPLRDVGWPSIEPQLRQIRYACIVHATGAVFFSRSALVDSPCIYRNGCKFSVLTSWMASKGFYKRQINV